MLPAVLAILAATAAAGDTFSVHPLIADHVVLQTTDEGGEGAVVSGNAAGERNSLSPYAFAALSNGSSACTCIPLWTKAGETISLSVVEGAKVVKKATAKADSKGAWQMKLGMASGGPYTVQIVGSKSSNNVTVADVLFGDVYVSRRFCKNKAFQIQHFIS